MKTGFFYDMMMLKQFKLLTLSNKTCVDNLEPSHTPRDDLFNIEHDLLDMEARVFL